MLFKKYILTTFRLIIGKWWLSLIKMFSLTSGITSFLLVWLFYFDQHLFLRTDQLGNKFSSLDNVLLLTFIILVTTIIYFLVVRSQISFRHTELFVRKLYGESSSGIVVILIFEMSIFILISFLLSLILIDQISPFFNAFTNKNVHVESRMNIFNFILISCFMLTLGIVIGIFPSIWYARKRALDIQKKLQ